MVDHIVEELQLRNVLNIIFKRKNQILIIFGLTVFLVTAATLLIKPSYEATAQILVTLGRGNMLFSNMGDQAQPVFIEQESVLNSEIEILKSNLLSERVIRELGGVQAVFPDSGKGGLFSGSENTAQENQKEYQLDLADAISKIQKSMRLNVPKKSNLITVGFQHQDPKLSADFVNKLVDAYLEHRVEIRRTKKSHDFLRNQAELLQQKLISSEKELEILRSEHKLSNFEEQKSILLRQKSELQALLNQTISSEAETNSKVGELRKKLEPMPQRISQAQTDDYNRPLISNLETRLVELELEEKNLSNKYTDQNRQLTKVREEIQIIRKKLAEQETKIYGMSTSGMNPVYQNLQQDLIRYEAERRSLSARREVLAKQFSDAENKLLEFDRIEMKFNQLKQEVESNKKNYDLYRTKVEESRISEAMDSEKISNISVVEPATIPIRPVSPKLFLNIILAVALGLIGGFASAFFSEYLRDRVENPEDIERFLNLPVLVSIPELKIRIREN